MSRLRLLLLILVAPLGCDLPTETQVPGSEVMGTFAFNSATGVPSEPSCVLLSDLAGRVAPELHFQAVLSREQETGASDAEEGACRLRLLCCSSRPCDLPTETQVPGSEVMGTFAFSSATGVPSEPSCVLLSDLGGNVAPELHFQAVLSREQETGEAWYTLRGTSHEAGFDGQVVRVVSRAERQFAACIPADQPERTDCAKVFVEETLEVALLSRSQNDALAGRCPAEAPWDGIPPPDGAEIHGPGTTPTGFDAVRACGVLVDRLVPEEGCCAPCSVAYRVEGVRR